jgi:hypothetical protein
MIVFRGPMANEDHKRGGQSGDREHCLPCWTGWRNRHRHLHRAHVRPAAVGSQLGHAFGQLGVGVRKDLAGWLRRGHAVNHTCGVIRLPAPDRQNDGTRSMPNQSGLVPRRGDRRWCNSSSRNDLIRDMNQRTAATAADDEWARDSLQRKRLASGLNLAKHGRTKLRSTRRPRPSDNRS